jgi:hypothetical protein
MAHDTQAGEKYLQLAQMCTSVSTLLYAISENAAALYQRYLDADRVLTKQSYDAMNTCVEALKKSQSK